MKEIFKLAVLLLVLTAAVTHASIIIKANNYTLSPVPDLQAEFGPNLGEGIEGQLVLSDPEDGCRELAVPPIKDAWIALIARSHRDTSSCSFNTKVGNAEAAGASAAIVYDNSFEPLIIMAKPLGSGEPGIPSVFISQKAGILLKTLVQADDTFALILPMEEGMWMSVLLSSLAGLSCVTLVIATFLFISQRQRLRSVPGQFGYRLVPDEGMTAAQLRALPVIVFDKPHLLNAVSPEGSDDEGKENSDSSGSDTGEKGGGTRKTCAVCIEDYRDGEKLRVLPCQHRFHMECIDQWLSSRKPLCPICKWDAKEDFVVNASDIADPESATPPSPRPVQTRRWRWNWGRSIVQHQSPPTSSRLSSPHNTEAIPSDPVSVQSPENARLWRPLFGMRSTPQNFPNMHAVPNSPPEEA